MSDFRFFNPSGATQIDTNFIRMFLRYHIVAAKNTPVSLAASNPVIYIGNSADYTYIQGFNLAGGVLTFSCPQDTEVYIYDSPLDPGGPAIRMYNQSGQLTYISNQRPLNVLGSMIVGPYWQGGRNNFRDPGYNYNFLPSSRYAVCMNNFRPGINGLTSSIPGLIYQPQICYEAIKVHANGFQAKFLQFGVWLARAPSNNFFAWPDNVYATIIDVSQIP